MSRFKIYLVILAALSLQLFFIGHIKIFNATPDLLSICVIFFGLFFNASLGFEAGVAAGLLKDLYGFGCIGVNALSLGIIGLVIGSLNTKIFKESKITQFVILFFFSAFSTALNMALPSFVLKNYHIQIAKYIGSYILPSASYTAITGMFVFSWLRKYFGVTLENDDL